jgi:tetratricopeptide (TPR) repeat protein
VLAKVPGLKVTARTSAFYFKGRQVSIAEIAEKLGVAYVVDGSVQKVGSRVRIKAQLIKAADGFQVWSESFEKELKDIFALQDEIAGLIAKNLALKLGASTPTGPIDPEVFRLYLEGRQEWSKRHVEYLMKAQALFERAIAIDPKFARAHAGLADVWIIRANYSLLDQRREDLARGREHLDRALELDPNLAEAHATRGLELFFRRDSRADAVAAAYQRALELNPNYATAHQWYGRFLFDVGKVKAGISELEVATRLDPLSPIVTGNYALVLGTARRWKEALAACDRALTIQPDFTQALVWRAAALIGLERRPEALALLRPLAERDLGGSFYNQLLTISYLALAGDRAKAEELATPFLDDRARMFQQGGLIFHLYVALGRIEEAFALWEQIDRKGAAGAGFFVGSVFDPVREDPRFLRKLEKIGLLAEYREAWSQVVAWEKQSRQQ